MRSKRPAPLRLCSLKLLDGLLSGEKPILTLVFSHSTHPTTKDHETRSAFSGVLACRLHVLQNGSLDLRRSHN